MDWIMRLNDLYQWSFRIGLSCWLFNVNLYIDQAQLRIIPRPKYRCRALEPRLTFKPTQSGPRPETHAHKTQRRAQLLGPNLYLAQLRSPWASLSAAKVQRTNSIAQLDTSNFKGTFGNYIFKYFCPKTLNYFDFRCYIIPYHRVFGSPKDLKIGISKKDPPHLFSNYPISKHLPGYWENDHVCQTCPKC